MGIVFILKDSNPARTGKKENKMIIYHYPSLSLPFCYMPNRPDNWLVKMRETLLDNSIQAGEDYGRF